MTESLNIATRESPLAVWQADFVADQLKANTPSLDVQLVKMSTRGDKILDQALSKVGGKDLFVKEIEHALLDGRAQVAVHSLKDMPTDLPDGLQVTAYPPREDPRDAIVSTRGYTLDTLPNGAVVGTCSLRRAAQILRRRPDVKIVEIRGNVQTRLRKLDEQGMDATLLAYAGLKRLKMEHLATHVLSHEECLPAIGQGILAVETKTDDSATNGHVDRLDAAPARAAATAERAFLHRLHGGCQVPIAGHATIEGDRVSLRGLVSSLDGQQVFEGTVEGAASEAEALGIHLADELLGRGADRVLATLMAPSAHA